MTGVLERFSYGNEFKILLTLKPIVAVSWVSVSLLHISLCDLWIVGEFC